MEFVVQGKKGNGKGIMAVAMIEEYLQAGKPVATNLNMYLENLLPLTSKVSVFRLPDQPTYQDMVNLGDVQTGGDERKNGLIVLDECASWLNARDYSDPERKRLLDWFVHSRKHGWDVVYVIQSINMLDKQFRDGFAEHLVTVVRLDRMGVPVLGVIFRLFGFALRFPQIHVGIVRYGTAANSPVVERKMKRGKRFWKAYDTLQKFSKLNEYQGVSCTLPAWHVKGRYLSWWQMYKFVMFSSFGAGALIAFVFVCSVGKLMGYERPKVQTVAAAPAEKTSEISLTGYVFFGHRMLATLADGRNVESEIYSQTPQGYRIKVGDTWFAEKQ